MSDSSVQALLRRAVQDSDASAMREAIDLLLGGGSSALSPEAELEVRHPDYVMYMPQSGERIRGRDTMRAMQQAFPGPRHPYLYAEWPVPGRPGLLKA
jgi:hypothetical protein